ncbi:L-proline trans-4-hydroxylase [Biomphalaria glabrata]|nr:L-proline trans-4-hydroxylase [Biomphalaria glabrata]
MPGLNEYYYDGQELVVNDQMKQDFKQDGFIIVRNLLSQQELAIVELLIQSKTEAEVGCGKRSNHLKPRTSGLRHLVLTYYLWSDDL